VMVGICVERSLEMAVGLLGILKAGGAFVPLDPEYPKERLEFMLEDADLLVLLTQAHLLGAFPRHKAKIIRLDEDWPAIAAEQVINLADLATANHLAYMIYTSGSTGTPKGVLVERGALVQHCLECRDFYHLSSCDRVLQFASLSFDPTIEQILPPLFSGACVILRETEVWTPDEFQRKLADLGLTVINLPPAYWHQLAVAWADSGKAVSAHQLRLVIIGGDAMSIQTLRLWERTPLNGVRLLNAYGPTETVITATSFEVPARGNGRFELERIPIGRLRGAREIYVLDRSGQLVSGRIAHWRGRLGSWIS
jgi:non-ribosomal peptide synthetase component F